MFKRFTDCDKWNDPWYRKLPPSYKSFWQYLCDQCDNAGVWKVDLETAAYFIGSPLLEAEAIKILNGRIQILSTEYWLIKKFVEFQFGALSPSSPPHKSVLTLIKKHTLTLPYPYPSTRVQDKDKEKEVVDVDVKVKDVDVVSPHAFESVWQRYPKKDGRKAAERHFKSSVKTMVDFLDLQKALENYLASDRVLNGYVKNGDTWFNNWRDWITYTEVKPNAPHGNKSAFSYIAYIRAKREAEKSGKEPPPGPLSHGVRDMPDVPVESPQR